MHHWKEERSRRGQVMGCDERYSAGPGAQMSSYSTYSAIVSESPVKTCISLTLTNTSAPFCNCS